MEKVNYHNERVYEFVLSCSPKGEITYKKEQRNDKK
jgi:hypothetical protein